MTFDKLKDLIQKNKIPSDVKLESDSGWECDPTDMDGVYYNKVKNINNSFCLDEGIELVSFSEDDLYENLYKEELKRSHEFELYYGIKETDARYDMIKLEQPLFWSIMLIHDRKQSFIGYVGFSIENEDFSTEIYIFKEYRRKGYGKMILKTLINYAKEGRLKIYDETSQEIKSCIPKRILATVRTENIASRALMESCGFKPVVDFVSVMLADDENLLSSGECINCVKYIYE